MKSIDIRKDVIPSVQLVGFHNEELNEYAHFSTYVTHKSWDWDIENRKDELRLLAGSDDSQLESSSQLLLRSQIPFIACPIHLKRQNHLSV